MTHCASNRCLKSRHHHLADRIRKARRDDVSINRRAVATQRERSSARCFSEHSACISAVLLAVVVDIVFSSSDCEMAIAGIRQHLIDCSRKGADRCGGYPMRIIHRCT